MSYLIRRPFNNEGGRQNNDDDDDDDDRDEPGAHSVDNFVNISWQFSIEALKAEIASDLAWLKAETSGQALLPSRKFKRRLDATTNLRRTKKPKYLIVEYTNVFFKPKFCEKSSEKIFNSDIER